MQTRMFLPIAIASLVVALFHTGSDSLRGQTPSSVALTGQVSSQEEGPMEGVLVSARRVGSTFTITVVSDQQGRYNFPRMRLDPGEYSLRMRAVGYDLDDPGAVQITAQKTASVDLKLHKARDLSVQLTSAEWLMSFPGTVEQKTFLLQCGSCHTLERVAKSHHDVDEWMAVYQRMASYTPDTTPNRIQKKVGEPSGFGNPQRLRKQAEWMATINLSAVEKWAYPLKTLPRPTGMGTHVVITEYDLPRQDSLPHDLTVDSKGMVWYNDAGWQYVGKLDPKTAEVVEYSVPKIKPDYPVGMLDMQADKSGNLWLAMMDQGKIASFDAETLKFKVWDLPTEEKIDVRINFLAPLHDDVDGKVWAGDNDAREVRRLDIRSGDVETFKLFKDVPGGQGAHRCYEITSDSQNNCWCMDLGANYIGRVDAKTGKATLYPTPTPDAGPRRGTMDSQDRLWFGEFRGNGIGMFDTREERFQEWVVPSAYDAPYGAAADKNGEVWSAGMTSDRVQRLNPKTGQFIEYLVPRYSSLRRIAFDNSKPVVTFWAPNKNSASIIKLETFD